MTGRHSKYLPARLLVRYQEMAHDTELLALRDEIALLDARIGDVLQLVESGESSRIWRELAAVERKASVAVRHGESEAAADALAHLHALVNAGGGDWAAWADVRELIQERKRLVESERKRLMAAQHLIAVEDAMAVMGLLVEAVRRHVRDEASLRAVTEEYARLVGPPLPAGPEEAGSGTEAGGACDRREGKPDADTSGQKRTGIEHRAVERH